MDSMFRSSSVRRRKGGLNEGRAKRSSGPGLKKQASSGGARRFEYSPPPVLARGLMAEAPAMARRKGSRPKRRYDVSLGNSGAEIRLPSLPHASVGWRGISFVLSALLLFAVYHVWNSPSFRVNEVEIAGLQRVSAGEVDALLDVTGRQVFAIDTGVIETDLRTYFPEFSDVSVQLGFPNTLAITITERVPVLTWIQDGKMQLVDAEGYAFPARNEGVGAPALMVEARTSPPLIAGMEMIEPSEGQDTLPAAILRGKAAMQPVQVRQLLTPEMVQAIQALNEQKPKDSPVVYDSQHGLGWRDARGWDVYFGNTQDIEIKLNLYSAMVQSLLAQEIQPALISVQWVDAPYYRTER